MIKVRYQNLRVLFKLYGYFYTFFSDFMILIISYFSKANVFDFCFQKIYFSYTSITKYGSSNFNHLPVII